MGPEALQKVKERVLKVQQSRNNGTELRNVGYTRPMVTRKGPAALERRRRRLFSWFARMDLENLRKESVHLSVPTRF